MPGVRDPHPPVKRRVRGPGDTGAPSRPRLHSQPGAPPPQTKRPGAPPPTPPVSSQPSRQIPESRPAADRGIGLLIVFTAGVLVMVGLVTLTAVIGSWWVLGPVMAFDFVVTATVLAIIVRLLAD